MTLAVTNLQKIAQYTFVSCCWRTYAHSQVPGTGGSYIIYKAILQSAFSVLCPLPDVDKLFEDVDVNQLRFKYVLHHYYCCLCTCYTATAAQ